VPRFVLVLVEPKYGGNIGACARAAMNFGVGELWLVGNAGIDREARQRAMHAEPLLDSARRFATLAEAAEHADILVGTSDIRGGQEKKVHRYNLTPRELAARVKGKRGTVALVFGREDYGLYREEMRLCDLQVCIPTSKDYEAMNLSHAAAVLLYELFLASGEAKRSVRPGHVPISRRDAERLAREWDAVVDFIRYPDHKRPATKLLFRKLLARAVPSAWEYHTMMGVFKRIREKRSGVATKKRRAARRRKVRVRRSG
jgi:TrmH family RNA methyltransferase